MLAPACPPAQGDILSKSFALRILVDSAQKLSERRRVPAGRATAFSPEQGSGGVSAVSSSCFSREQLSSEDRCQWKRSGPGPLSDRRLKAVACNSHSHGLPRAELVTAETWNLREVLPEGENGLRYGDSLTGEEHKVVGGAGSEVEEDGPAQAVDGEEGVAASASCQACVDRASTESTPGLHSGPPRLRTRAELELRIEQEKREAGNEGEAPGSGLKQVVQAVAWALEGVTVEQEVEALLGGSSFPSRVFSSVLHVLGTMGNVRAALALFRWLVPPLAGDAAHGVQAEPGKPFPYPLDEPGNSLDGSGGGLTEQQQARSEEADESAEMPSAIQSCGTSSSIFGKDTIYFFNSLLGALKANEEFEEMQRVLSWMEAAHVVPDVVTYNTLISMHKLMKQPQAAIAVSASMSKAGIKANVFTYKTLLSICAEEGWPAEALRLLAAAESSDLATRREGHECQMNEIRPLVIKVCRSVLAALLAKSAAAPPAFDNSPLRWPPSTRQRRPRDSDSEESSQESPKRSRQSQEQYPRHNAEAVVLLLDHMAVHSIPPSQRLLKQAIWACAAVGGNRFSVVGVRLLKEFREAGGIPDLTLCSSLLRSIRKARKWGAAMEVFEGMMTLGPLPDRTSYMEMENLVMGMLVSAKNRRQWKWALRIVQLATAVGLEPQLSCWRLLLMTCAAAGQAGATARVFEEMLERGFKADVVSCGILLSSLEKSKLVEQALELWASMPSMGVTPNLHAYTTMITLFGRRGDYGKAVEMFEEMKKAGCTPDLVAYNAMVSACVATGQGLRALDWIEQMKSAWVEPNAITYEQALEALANEGQWEGATQVYMHMKAEGLKPSPATYDSLVRVCSANRADVDLTTLKSRHMDRLVKDAPLLPAPVSLV